ncbi:hypothetical protein QWZ03_11290 [Chitinimonas viridis]|uniref:Uncharacterized protein n=1 Tax=Chitinimonas viridis TaxID=664880 RepID=A0ABT8B5R1_9NEIS|nr:hypothetical protein [Chitinimonas viridis]MDN3577350.1 hypothetical protein [Chitinimonas viridis]
MSKYKLGQEKHSYLAQKFASEGGGAFELIEFLKERGIAAFMPQLESLFDRCISDQEKRDLDLYLCEVVKERIGSMHYNRPTGWGGGPWPGYKSEILERFRRGEIYKPLDYDFYPERWGEVEGEHPVFYRRRIEMMEDNGRFKERERMWEGGRDKRLKEEAFALGGEGRAYDLSGKCDRLEFYQMILAAETKVLGFSFDEKSSGPEYPVFSKQLTEKWKISWVLNDSSYLAPFHEQGSLDALLQLRPVKSPRQRSRLKDEYTSLYLNYAIPTFHCYLPFRSLENFEVCIKAHVRVFEFFWVRLENIICECLGD